MAAMWWPHNWWEGTYPPTQLRTATTGGYAGQRVVVLWDGTHPLVRLRPAPPLPHKKGDLLLLLLLRLRLLLLLMLLLLLQGGTPPQNDTPLHLPGFGFRN